MDREDYITNIHAYWRHNQKVPSTSKAPNTASSLPPVKRRQSKLSAGYGDSSSQPHEGTDQCGIDYDDYQNGDKEDGECSSPRYKDKNRQSQNEWDDECHKDIRRKGKNRTVDDQLYAEDYWDYDDEDIDYDYNDNSN